jgi:hypothetical protein
VVVGWSDGDVGFGCDAAQGQAPTVSFPDSGRTILSYSYKGTASDVAGINAAAGKMEVSCTFDMTVSVEGNEIVIVQHLVTWMYIRRWATEASGNVVDKQITDTYTVGVDDQGNLRAALKSSDLADNSQQPEANPFLNFWENVQSYTDIAAKFMGSLSTGNLTDVPVSFIQNFIFPGGSTFCFADAGFSDYQDLVSHITYADVPQEGRAS